MAYDLFNNRTLRLEGFLLSEHPSLLRYDEEKEKLRELLRQLTYIVEYLSDRCQVPCGLYIHGFHRSQWSISLRY